MKVISHSYCGTVLTVNAEQGTVSVDIGAVDKDSNPVYMTDVPFDGTLIHPKAGDKISVCVEKREDA